MSCALELIYRAAMRTPDVTTPGRAMVHYDSAPAGDLRGRCWLCGCETTAGLLMAKVIKPTFTDSGLARVPWSNVVCEHCCWALFYRSLRNYSILATNDGLRHPSRQETRGLLLDPPRPPFVLCVAESGQRWLHLRAHVNHRRDMLTVQLEDLAVAVQPLRFAGLLSAIEDLLQVFSKGEIASGQYQPHRIQQFGMERFEGLEARLEPVRKSGLFRLALHVATIPERRPARKQQAAPPVQAAGQGTLI